ncbi:L-histidine N(alpha)-methyltransferase [Pedobacter yonginense]|uniref:L-histidine N(Alpha)-methyltransferase n=1 Tax=Pedobacter yonginense TaxID=651869 RepID=A0A317ESR7_9SPHI|nr:L-histidine N(alpha)-methyltransferase [Pedobacter yonginense]PWS29455.1 L-histidine N(alpha)-methyltransferase [Pedobacter yonginense]
MSTITTETTTTNKTQFLEETLIGLKSEPKFMQSKYFYDEKGDYIFQQIMNMEEYYLTDAEMDILSNQTAQLAKVITAPGDPFDLIELGAGDATKSVHLLKALIEQKHDFTYFPIDISEHVIADLEENLPLKLPTLNLQGLNGDYFAMLKRATEISSRRKVMLFMGANIGNMNVDEARDFCIDLRNLLSKGDMLIVGFDLKKNPQQILAAYDDEAGITSSFNLNLLQRINRELEGDFDLDGFEHYASYDPETGACKSYLISLKNQEVKIGQKERISFAANEYIFMEISQKYSLKEIEQLAKSSGFNVLTHFSDAKGYFVDAVWTLN